MQDERLYAVLAFAGATPFVACAILVAMSVPSVEPLGQLDAIAESYGLAIISFLCGAHWATRLYEQPEGPFNLMIVSNVVLLAVWFAFVLGSIAVSLVTQIVAFLALLSIDWLLYKARSIANHYFIVRSVATGLAVVSLALITLSAP